MTDLHQKEFSDVELNHMYADNCAMQLVRFPKQFDVIVTDNLFGDILSDCAAMLTGSLGMLPSASLGAVDSTGRRAGMYEPVHGSAPDISGQDKANPIAMIMSFAMMLNYSFDMNEESDLIEKKLPKDLKSIIVEYMGIPPNIRTSPKQIHTSPKKQIILNITNKLLVLQ